MECPDMMLSGPSYCNSLPVTGCVGEGIHNTILKYLSFVFLGIHFSGYYKTHVFRKNFFSKIAPFMHAVFILLL